FYKIVRQTKLQNDGYGRYMDATLNESKIVTFSKVDYLPGWTLFVTTKESEIFHDIYTIMYDVLVTSIILMVIFLLLISELSNRITKPIVQLTKDVKASV
ncbi:MAG TPA: diguanylate cyclase, partial [Shewanella frigidimarina]|nr:diguanylate cyclase [Shewanella frigidimarina]